MDRIYSVLKSGRGLSEKVWKLVPSKSVLTTLTLAAVSGAALFAIGQRIGFWRGKHKTSAVIYDVGPTMYCVTAWFGRNYVNLGIDHDDAWLANASDQ